MVVKPSHLARNCGYSSLMLPATCMSPHKKKTSLPPARGGKVFLVYRKDVAQASVKTLAMIFQPSGPFFRAWKST